MTVQARHHAGVVPACSDYQGGKCWLEIKGRSNDWTNKNCEVTLKFITIISGAFYNIYLNLLFVTYFKIQFIIGSKHTIKMSGNTAPTFSSPNGKYRLLTISSHSRRVFTFRFDFMNANFAQ